MQLASLPRSGCNSFQLAELPAPLTTHQPALQDREGREGEGRGTSQKHLVIFSFPTFYFRRCPPVYGTCASVYDAERPTGEFKQFLLNGANLMTYVLVRSALSRLPTPFPLLPSLPTASAPLLRHPPFPSPSPSPPGLSPPPSQTLLKPPCNCRT